MTAQLLTSTRTARAHQPESATARPGRLGGIRSEGIALREAAQIAGRYAWRRSRGLVSEREAASLAFAWLADRPQLLVRFGRAHPAAVRNRLALEVVRQYLSKLIRQRLAISDECRNAEFRYSRGVIKHMLPFVLVGATPHNSVTEATGRSRHGSNPGEWYNWTTMAIDVRNALLTVLSSRERELLYRQYVDKAPEGSGATGSAQMTAQYPLDRIVRRMRDWLNGE